MFSGWDLRIAGTGLRVDARKLGMGLCGMQKVKADPSKSLVKDVDTSSCAFRVDPGLKFDLPKRVSVISLTISILVTIYGILNLELVIYGNGSHLHDWRYCVCSAINRVNLDDGINMVPDGARGAFSGAP